MVMTSGSGARNQIDPPHSKVKTPNKTPQDNAAPSAIGARYWRTLYRDSSSSVRLPRRSLKAGQGEHAGAAPSKGDDPRDSDRRGIVECTPYSGRRGVDAKADDRVRQSKSRCPNAAAFSALALSSE